MFGIIKKWIEILVDAEAGAFMVEAVRDDLFKDRWVSIGSEADDLSSVAIRVIAQRAGHALVESAKRVGEAKAVLASDLSSFTDPDRPGQAGPIAVQREDQRAVKAAR